MSTMLPHQTQVQVTQPPRQVSQLLPLPRTASSHILTARPLQLNRHAHLRT